REYQDSDLDSCAREMCDAFDSAPWNEKWDFDIAKKRIGIIMSSKESYGFVALDKGRVIAMIAGRILPYLDENEYWIDECSVLSLYQGKKIGSSLFAYMKEKLLGKATKVFLYTGRNFPAQHFYEKNGLRVLDGLVTMQGDI
ncbi:MAG: GNAT family N-acetyltransferase, partial [Bacilli bacterium]